MIHHEPDVREEQKYMYVARTSNNRVIPMEWSWWVTSNNACEPGEQLIVLANGNDESDLVGWSLLLHAATVRSFVHVPLGISDRNNTLIQKKRNSSPMKKKKESLKSRKTFLHRKIKWQRKKKYKKID